MKIEVETHDRLTNKLSGLRTTRQPWWQLWREIADFYIPKRYVWLLSPQERLNKNARNPMILDGTGTTAGRVLAAGMMNGITSPSRPWLRLRAPGFGDEDNSEASVWLDEVTRRLLLIFAESNFYNAMALLYIDLAFFGTAAVLIYEDYDDVLRCYNCALGEYYLGIDDRLAVSTFAREFSQTAEQLDQWFGKDNCSDTVKNKIELGGANLTHEFAVSHLIEPNVDGKDKLKGGWKFRETYWETAGVKGEVLSRKGFNEFPGIFPRWELTANDAYGTCPAMDALGDVIQLQHETKKKGQGLDKMISPPVIADIQLSHKPTALLPNGVTYVAGVNNVGVKPIYTVQLPLDMMSQDIRDVQVRIREIFHNDLFKMISQLQTVRSATEIDAREEEKLVLLGPVLERFKNEGLDQAVKRAYGIALRAGLLPPVPEVLSGVEIEIQYLSILTAAQTAVATIPTERWLGLIGNLAAVKPSVLDIPDWDWTVRQYGKDLGVRAKSIKDPQLVAQDRAAKEQVLAAQAGMQQVQQGAESAKLLSETEVGGGANALQRLINPYGV